MKYKDRPVVKASSANAWRNWLLKNHATCSAVWLIIFKKTSGIKTVVYDQAVDEALCFGWIDSVANPRDEDSYYIYFAPRKKKSKWSAVNKKKIDLLTAAGKLHPAGIAVIEEAKQNGYWDALNEVEQLIVPPDLALAFSKSKKALAHWEAFPRSAKRAILEWLSNAKRPETRNSRIQTIVADAAKNIRTNQPKQLKK